MIMTISLRKLKKPNYIILALFFCLSSYRIAAEVPCEVVFEPDLNLQSSNADIEAEIDSALKKYQDVFLGLSAPTSSDLTDAISNYNALNIVITDGVISGVTVNNDYKAVKFLKTFANHLRHNPGDTSIRIKANNTVWLVTDQICKGLISTDGASSLYSFDGFARPASIISRSFNDTIRALFDHAMNSYGAFEHFWEQEYDFTYQAINESINTDIMYNLGDALMAFSANRATADERYLWMRGYKRWVERFASHTSGTANGIKPDGTGFHHWTAYDNYMYAFKTASKVIYYLTNTSFQINRENYLLFRDAIYAQIVFGNDKALKPLSMSGRKPNSRNSQYSEETLKLLALAGGHILGLSTADTILAGEYNRLFGVSADFNYSTIAPISRSSGFFQFNYANMGIFRKDGWLAGMKGFTDGLWGAELYAAANRYGRYQSYGTLEIIYPGSEISGNGYNVSTWNWNYNPGTTTIVLPWSKLHGEFARIDESQAKGFCGALAFKNRNSGTLNRTHGTVGGFAMDFQEREGVGFSTYYGPNGHNKTFRWKKSTWAFDDMIIALGSNINNNDASNPTVTTLFQRMDNKSVDLIVNGISHNQIADFDGGNNNWVISNYSTGFYMVAGNNETKVWNGEQQTPNHDQIDPSAYVNNPKGKYWIGYINHGTNPVDAEYEYIVIPAATKEIMTELDSDIKSNQKPYAVFQKNSDAHIIKHHSGTWGYAIFNASVDYSFPGLIKQASHPCLVMFKPNESNTEIKMAISNPDLGIESRSYLNVKDKVISITLEGEFVMADTGQSKIKDITFSDGNTTITFNTQKGNPIEINLMGEVPIYTGINEKSNQDRGIKIYPNPTDNEFSLDGELPENTSWKLYNSFGSCMKEGLITSSQNTIDVSDFAPGLYLIHVILENNLLYTGKILVN